MDSLLTLGVAARIEGGERPASLTVQLVEERVENCMEYFMWDGSGVIPVEFDLSNSILSTPDKFSIIRVSDAETPDTVNKYKVVGPSGRRISNAIKCYDYKMLVEGCEVGKPLSITPSIAMMKEQMKNIRKSEENSDVIIVCDGKEFKCHRNILCARSVVFNNMLQGNTSENLINKITIRDSSAEAVDEMLNYIYTGDLPCPTGELPCHKTLSDALNLALLELSDMYGLDILKEFCGMIISTRSDMRNSAPSA
eukprot:TRINITY_DN23677_c0_g1_i1.p1 TRINITY_DN23677_c0_g1~~TRINITY_DN23677_c0_g1_i1.p1  ORF type:complete len:253 (-),score=38.26 TRINITY_DN23677_c0_g1_i1:468-1226(-)